MIKRHAVVLSLVISLMCTTNAFSLGGSGASCNPSTANWGSCDLAAVPFASEVTNTVYIPGGNYSSPFIASQSNTEYILQGDITAEGTAISVSGNYIIINLNGNIITYNEAAPGEGVSVGAWNKHHISVRNGSIIQGAAGSGGDVTGGGNNPVSVYSSIHGQDYPADNFHVANLYTYIHGKDVGGIYLSTNNALVEENTVEDNYEFGTIENRHQGIDAIGVGKGSIVVGGVIRNNTIVNARHRGVTAGNSSQIYGNNISIRGIDSNSYGIFGWQSEDVSVHDNTINAVGASPVGVGFTAESGNPQNVSIFNNNIYAKTTALNEEYGGDPVCFSESHKCGLNAIGIRVHGYAASAVGMDNLEIYNNKVVVDVDSWYRGAYSPTGQAVWVNGKGKGMAIGVKGEEIANVYGNDITVLDEDGTGEAYGVSFAVNTSSNMFFYENTVRANVANIVFGDSYSSSKGYPLVTKNTLVKIDSFPSYDTYANKASGWSDSTGRISENLYSGGASVEEVSFTASGPGLVDIYIDNIHDDNYLYSYRLHDNDGISDILLREELSQVAFLGSNVPGETSPVIVPVEIGSSPEAVEEEIVPAAPSPPSALRVVP